MNNYLKTLPKKCSLALEIVIKSAMKIIPLLRHQRDFSVRRVVMLMRILCNILFFVTNHDRELCKMEKCSELCIKKELGEDDNKKGSWTMLFSRAPVNSDKCIESCYYGCLNRVKESE